MDEIPARHHLAKFYKNILSQLEDYLYLPQINPSYYQIAAIVLSIGFLYTGGLWSKVILLTFILLLDWFDGATARKYQKTNYEGLLIDMTADRLSEAFIFIKEIISPLGRIFFFLFLLNLVLSFVSLKLNKIFILPLRFIFLIILWLEIYGLF
ncbi:CDP-alcohol phosphatidyltransferase family protein [Candidatus Gottesmanbacteria bacterium]|nr:CDP-alcohol phosphatidyltransferase family protein [Candidatus Gottesmanbacteria bacterium]